MLHKQKVFAKVERSLVDRTTSLNHISKFRDYHDQSKESERILGGAVQYPPERAFPAGGAAQSYPDHVRPARGAA